ncbi:MAG: hypothetical protein RLZ35_1111 [Pseudomonadota bacterium]|jgi:ElaB/YqjD/DUF883 family membrane-anchored ribosome-binding protein
MFTYNRFWHYWHTAYERYRSGASSLPALLGLVITVPLSAIADLIWNHQNKKFKVLATNCNELLSSLNTALSSFSTKEKSSEEEVKISIEEIQILKESHKKLSQQREAVLAYQQKLAFYLNNRVVCSDKLFDHDKLEGLKDEALLKFIVNNLKQSKEINKKTTITDQIILTENLDIYNNLKPSHLASNTNRNQGYCVDDGKQAFYVKRTNLKDTLSEIAAQEMAEICGFSGLIPSNAVVYKDESGTPLPLPTEQNISNLISESENEYFRSKGVKTISNGAKNVLAKLARKFRTKRLQKQLETNTAPDEILYVQTFMPQSLTGTDFIKMTGDQLEQDAKNFLIQIDQISFEENFLLQIILGSQDANPGNTLFVKTTDRHRKLYSIDHERIMPDNNYDVTKPIPMAGVPTEVEFKHVFPIRLWLAGLPQANRAFSTQTIQKVLSHLDPEKLLAYHRNKKLFSSAAVMAQYERVQLIRSLFEEEQKKKTKTLTPRDLLLKLVDNHPTYHFLKNHMGLNDLYTFLLLGKIPEGADWSLLRHPLQTLPMWGLLVDKINNKPIFPCNPYLPNFHMYCTAVTLKSVDTSNAVARKLETMRL